MSRYFYKIIATGLVPCLLTFPLQARDVSHPPSFEEQALAPKGYSSNIEAVRRAIRYSLRLRDDNRAPRAVYVLKDILGRTDHLPSQLRIYTALIKTLKIVGRPEQALRYIGKAEKVIQKLKTEAVLQNNANELVDLARETARLKVTKAATLDTLERLEDAIRVLSPDGGVYIDPTLEKDDIAIHVFANLQSRRYHQRTQQAHHALSLTRAAAQMMRDKRFMDAEEAIEQAYEISDPSSPIRISVLNTWGTLLSFQRNTKAALAKLHEALELIERQREAERRIPDVQQSHNLDIQEAYVRVSLSKTHTSAHQWNEAVAALSNDGGKTIIEAVAKDRLAPRQLAHVLSIVSRRYADPPIPRFTQSIAGIPENLTAEQLMDYKRYEEALQLLDFEFYRIGIPAFSLRAMVVATRLAEVYRHLQRWREEAIQAMNRAHEIAFALWKGEGDEFVAPWRLAYELEKLLVTRAEIWRDLEEDELAIRELSSDGQRIKELLRENSRAEEIFDLLLERRRNRFQGGSSAA